MNGYVPERASGLPPVWYAFIGAVLTAVGVAVYLLAGSTSGAAGAPAGRPAGSAAASSSSTPTSSGAHTPTTPNSGDTGKPAIHPLVSSATASAQVVESVEVTFESVPSEVDVFRAGKKLGRAPGPIRFERGQEEITLSFRKAGYVSRELKLTPDKNKNIKVELVIGRAARPSDGLE